MTGTRTRRLALVVMGVSGSGKTTLGEALAGALGLVFIDGDDLHGAANVAKMTAGEPLDDTDRAPWLDRIAEVLSDNAARPDGVVVACSALKRAYRDRMRQGAPGARLVFQDADRTLVEHRLEARRGHFMPASLLDSQFDTLEPPGVDETDVLTVPAALPTATQAARVKAWLQVG